MCAGAGGSDDALVEWRKRGRVCPWPLPSRWLWVLPPPGSRFGFFLEYDRGPTTPGDYPPNLRLLPLIATLETPPAITMAFHAAPGHHSDVARPLAHRVLPRPTSSTAALRPACCSTTTDANRSARRGVLGPVWRVPSTIGSGLDQCAATGYPATSARRLRADAVPNARFRGGSGA